MSSTWKVAVGLTAAFFGAIAIGGQTASASNVTFENDGVTLQVRADKDPANNMQIGLAPGNPADYRITDSASEIFAPPGVCLEETSHSWRCPSEKVGSISVFLSNGSDTFSVLDPASIPQGVALTVRGGLGDDRITGRNGAGKESLFGNEGNDSLTAQCPGDAKTVNGGPGNDTMSICGTTQPKSFITTDVAVALAAPSPVAFMFGEGGNDKLLGGPESDKIKGGPGKDVAKGGAGNDIIDCGGGKRDLGVGGPGRDLGKNCEKVKH